MSVESVSMQMPPPVLSVVRPSGGEATTPTAAPANQAEALKTVTAAKPTASTDQQLKDAVKAIEDFIRPITSNLDFSIDEDTSMRVVKVIDNSTKEVIRQFPSEEVLQIAKALDRLQGLLIEQKA